MPTAADTVVRNCRQTDDGFRHDHIVLRHDVERRMLELYADIRIRVNRAA